MERAGIPTALLCTDEFGPLARAESEVLGVAALPLIPVPHPLAGNERPLVDAKADAVVSDIQAALTLSASALDAKYREQFRHLTDKRLSGGAVCIDTTCVLEPGISGPNMASDT